MEMFYLVLRLNTAAVVIPEKYPKEQCESLKNFGNPTSFCIPAPDDSEYFNCTTLIPIGALTINAKIHCNIKTGK